MKVAELIEKLQMFPEGANVCLYVNGTFIFAEGQVILEDGTGDVIIA